MSRTYHHGERKNRVRGVRRPTDLSRSSRAMVELEYQATQAEVEAEAGHNKQRKTKRGRNQRRNDANGEAGS